MINAIFKYETCDGLRGIIEYKQCKIFNNFGPFKKDETFDKIDININTGLMQCYNHVREDPNQPLVLVIKYTLQLRLN